MKSYKIVYTNGDIASGIYAGRNAQQTAETFAALISSKGLGVGRDTCIHKQERGAWINTGRCFRNGKLSKPQLALLNGARKSKKRKR